MSDVQSSLSIKPKVKDRLGNLEFVRKQSFEKIIETLMDFYEENKEKFETWKIKKK